MKDNKEDLYSLTEDREPLMYFKEIQRQLYVKSFLDEIQKDEPNLDALLSTPEQFGEIADPVYAMPEFDDIFIPEDPDELDSERKMDVENLTRIVTRNGKQTFENDMPGKMSEYLHDLEKKGLKGKAKDNSDEFNRLLANYGETLRKLDSTTASNKEVESEIQNDTVTKEELEVKGLGEF